MAIGDAGAAAGYEVVPSTQDWRLGYQRINQKADELAALKAALAAEVAARAAADGTLTAAVATKLDASKVVFNASQPPFVAGTIWLKPV